MDNERLQEIKDKMAEGANELREGFAWPLMLDDCQELIAAVEEAQAEADAYDCVLNKRALQIDSLHKANSDLRKQLTEAQEENDRMRIRLGSIRSVS